MRSESSVLPEDYVRPRSSVRSTFFAIFVATLKVLFGALFGMASLILLWFVVSLVHSFWGVPFDRAGELVRKLPRIGVDSWFDFDGSTWLLIVSLWIVTGGVSWARRAFIRDLAKAIREGEES